MPTVPPPTQTQSPTPSAMAASQGGPAQNPPPEPTKPELVAPPTPSGVAPKASEIPAPVEERPAALDWLDKFAFNEGDSEATPAEVVAPPTEAKPQPAIAEPPPEPPAPKEKAAPAEAAPLEAPKESEAPTPEVAAEEPKPLPKAGEPLKPAEVEEWKKIRAEATAQLEKVYTFDEAAKESLGEEMSQQLPQMAAKLHMNVYEAVMNAVYGILPRIVRDIQAVDNARSAFDQQFFNRWPGLKAHAGDVQRALQVYSQLNPRASAQQLIDEVGLQVSVLRKVPIPGFSAAPAVPEPTAPRFIPAAPSGGGGAPMAPNPSPNSKYTQFIENEE